MCTQTFFHQADSTFLHRPCSNYYLTDDPRSTIGVNHSLEGVTTSLGWFSCPRLENIFWTGSKYTSQLTVRITILFLHQTVSSSCLWQCHNSSLNRHYLPDSATRTISLLSTVTFCWYTTTPLSRQALVHYCHHLHSAPIAAYSLSRPILAFFLIQRLSLLRLQYQEDW